MELWIVLLLVASGLSAWIGFTYARKNGPSKAELDALESELDEVRRQAETMQAGVNDHFEQSAMLFGRLAKDYREFLDHFSDSAQALGLSEQRARELIEQGFQPVLTHDAVAEQRPNREEPTISEPEPEAEPEPIPEPASSPDPKPSTVRAVHPEESEPLEPEPPLIDDIVVLEAEPETESEAETARRPEADGSAGGGPNVVVDLPESESGKPAARADQPDNRKTNP
ncbi:MAG: DUF1043 family protein [Gammaproteobacteria bacterium]